MIYRKTPPTRRIYIQEIKMPAMQFRALRYIPLSFQKPRATSSGSTGEMQVGLFAVS